MLNKKIFTLIFIIFSVFIMVSCGGNTANTDVTTAIPTTEDSTTESTYTLPDLQGKSKTEITSVLDGLLANYTFVLEQNTELTEDLFIRYENGLEAGETVNLDTNIIVVIATPNYVLPDFSGQTQNEIFLTLLGKGVNFIFEVEVNNDVPDQTFSGFGNGLIAGDAVNSETQVIIYIGFNTTRLPDLTGKLKGEIEKILIENQISYNFEYVVNDEYQEDLFVEYKDFEINDFYEEGTITVILYQNTFTNAPTSLIISKYIDGGTDTNDQAIEIYNATESSIFLGDYHLALYMNGSYEVTNIIDFNDVDLLPGETYLIANQASTNGNLLRKADDYMFELNFDGNDTIQLRYKNNTYIDSIYHIGNTAFVMDNEIYVRKANVVTGVRNFVYTQWTAYVPSYIDVIGTHPVSLLDEITFSYIDRIFDSPLGGMTSVTVVGINDGDTASFSPGFIDNERVRFLGVDTPETSPTVVPIPEPWGIEAKDYTTLILNNAIEIYIQSDPDLGYADTYGRHLGLVWVNLGTPGLTVEIKNSSDEVVRTEYLSGWILLNYHLVLNGFSYNYYGSASTLVFDDRYLYHWFQDAQLFAQENGLGIHE